MSRPTVKALVAVALAAGLTACGGSGSSPGQGASTSSGLNGEQTKTATQVLADTKSALFNATSVHTSRAP